METYADLLKREKEKVEKNMTNYDMDQLRRDGQVPDLQKRKEFAEDIIESEELPKGSTNIDIEISNRDLLHLAKAAHDRDITLNQLCIDVLKSAFDDLDYRFEHSSKPVVLSEY
ncbi:uncharacterized protein METZ01_LOCUS464316 [marine metagenome]|uniref:Uncharacterized protein n=1 Tax=marine metagenome TaxID=408172 RepID=A0A383AUS1_9ZZZZ